MIDRWVYSTCEKWIRNGEEKKNVLISRMEFGEKLKIRKNIGNKF